MKILILNLQKNLFYPFVNSLYKNFEFLLKNFKTYTKQYKIIKNLNN